MKHLPWVALASGTLFGLGLAVSGMTNPAKVLAFLDVAGRWDPSLALVMASALFFMAIAWRLHEHPSPAGWRAAQGAQAILPESGRVDASLVSGALLFGVGWGLVGYCPGPAFASLGHAGLKPLVFVLAMLAGMLLHRAWEARQRERRLSDARA